MKEEKYWNLWLFVEYLRQKNAKAFMLNMLINGPGNNMEEPETGVIHLDGGEEKTALTIMLYTFGLGENDI